MRLAFEPLEQRALLSATMQFHHILFDPATGTPFLPSSAAAMTANMLPLSSASPPGSALTPLKIRTAYGISSIAGDGAGQTIAIVDAYRDPNIVNDLHQFDLQFGLADPPSFQQLNQNGGSDASVPTDPGGAGNPNGTWEEEEALDVEWAHAVAPGANIILFEANSPSDANLWAAVDTARNYSGVSVVSMSFGGSESSGDTSANIHFTTPSGHNGVTFLASTGDSGSPSGYPAYSPNVVAVGGTSLTLSGNNYSSESGWSGSGGGQSTVESKPAYQNSVNSSNFRQNPDVSFDANPNTGVAIYDSWDFGSSAPWIQIGGTSLSAPCWAGLIAIADQLRVAQGLTTLDGPTQTLPKLYALPAADFHDITSGSNGGFSAKAGYDEVTGLGTPIANLLVPALAVPPTPDLTIAKTHLGNFHPGDVGDAYAITVTNAGGAATGGTVTVIDALPAGLTATAMSGSGWSVNLATFTATRSDALAVGASYPALTVTVNVAANAPASVTNTATVSGGGETFTGNDTASDPTVIGLLTIAGTSPALSGGSLSAGAATLAINFNSAASGAGTASNYQLQSAGPDGLLGTADDILVSLAASYNGTTATLTFPPLVENVYRLTVKDSITDTAGVKLDGNGDGTAGGNWVTDFVVVPSANLLVNNSTFASGGTNPLSVAIGDFNGDGKPDLAVANNPLNGGTTSIGIFLGDGKGGFSAGTAVTAGLSSPYAVTAGDFNGDGKTDLAVANYGNNSIGIFLGNGSGGFTVGTAVTVGTQPISLATGDFNGDGKTDIAVADYGNNKISVLIGNGSGGFTAGSFNSGGTNPRAVAVADFNGDGKLDLVVTNYAGNNAVIFLGDGSGGFTAQPAAGTGGSHPRSIAVGDFNGDNKPDVVVGNHDSNNVSVLIGNGSGGLAAAVLFAAGGTNPRGVAVADFNGDGKADIAVSNSGSNNVGVLLGDGSGSFAAAATFGTNTTYGAFGIALGDINGDGRPDLAVTDTAASNSSNSLTTFLDYYGPAPVTLTTPHSYAFDVSTSSFGPGEFIQGTNDAFDGFGRLSVDGALFRPNNQTSTTADSGQTLATAAGTAAGLTVSRKTTVPASGGEDFARTVDVFTNPTSSDITATVQIVGNLGSDAATSIFATSSGDTTLTPADQWFGTTGGAGPALMYILHGPQGLQPASVSLTGDNVVWTYNLTVPAGQTRELGYFTIQAASTTQAVNEANALVGAAGFLDTAALGLTSADLTELANFQFGPQPLIVTPADWTLAGAAGMTLKLAADGKLHLYQTGTTTDIVAPLPFAAVNSVSITGRDNIDDALTVDFGGGNPIPAGGASFDGGAGGGNTLIIAGIPGDDSVVMTSSQITDNGSAPIAYGNVAFFGFDLAGGTNNLLLDHATLNLNQDGAVSAGTIVTIDGGTLNFNGHAEQIGNLVVTGGGQANVGSLNNSPATVTVGNGTLSAVSLTTDTLTIGGTLQAAATTPSAPSPTQNTPSASTATGEPSSVDNPPVAAVVSSAVPAPNAAISAASETSPGATAGLFRITKSGATAGLSSSARLPTNFITAGQTGSGAIFSSEIFSTAPQIAPLSPAIFSVIGTAPASFIASKDSAITLSKSPKLPIEIRDENTVNRAASSVGKEGAAERDSLEAVLRQLASRHIIGHASAEHRHRAFDAALAALDFTV